MIFTIISWLYMTFSAFCMGYLVHRCLKLFLRLEDESAVPFPLVCISGLLFTSFLVTILCLFMPLGLLSNLFILFLILLGLVFDGKNWIKTISYHFSEVRQTPVVLVIIFVIYLVATAYFSFVPSTHHDDGLYYSTSIKWLQEYGTVKGLTNLNTRIGFNSSWFILQAHFGFQFLKAGLFNDLNGLLYCYLLIYSLQGLRGLQKGCYDVPGILKAVFFLPLLTLHTAAQSDFFIYNVNMLSSPSADLPACMLLWLIFIVFLEGEQGPAQKGSFFSFLVVFYSVSVVSIKLSTTPVVILPGYLVCRMALTAKFKQAVLVFSSCCILIAPWIIRNVLLSGYLVFPFSHLDLFTVDWKTPIIHARYHEMAMKVFSVDPTMGFNRSVTTPLPTWAWIPAWFGRLQVVEKVSFLTAIGATLVFAGIAVWELVRLNFSFFQRYASRSLVIFTAVAGIGFWLYSAPDFRFGYGFLGIYCSFSMVLLIHSGLKNRSRFLQMILLIYPFIAVLDYANEFKYMVASFFKLPIAGQQPVEIKDVRTDHGQVFHVVTHDDCWNAPLPVATNSEFYYINPVFRGSSIGEGFKAGETH